MTDDWLGCYLFPDSEPQKKKRARKTDDVWDALVHVFYPSGVSDDRNEHGRVSQEVKRARAKLLPGIHKQAAIAALEERKARYMADKTYGSCPCTAKAVLDNWDVVGKDPLIQLREDCHEWVSRRPVVRELRDSFAEMYVYLEVVGNAGGLRQDKAVMEVARREWYRHVRNFGSMEGPNPHVAEMGRYRMLEVLRAAVKELA